MVIGPAPDSLRSNAAGRFLFGSMGPIGWVRTPRSADGPLPLFAVGCRWVFVRASSCAKCRFGIYLCYFFFFLIC